MTDPNYALQSQQFAQDATNQMQQRSVAYAQMNQDSAQHLIANLRMDRDMQFRQQQAQQQYSLQQREMQINEAASAEQINNLQMQRAAAAEALMWTRELHTTDMLKMERDSRELALRAQSAQVAKLERDLGGQEVDPFRISDDERLNAMASGINVQFSNGRAMVSKASEDVVAAAKEEKARQQKLREDYIRSQITHNEAQAEYYRNRQTGPSNEIAQQRENRLTLVNRASVIKQQLSVRGLPKEQADALTNELKQIDTALQDQADETTTAGSDLFQSQKNMFLGL